MTQHFSKLGWRVFCLDIAHPPALPLNTSYIPVDHSLLSNDARLHSTITSKLPPLSLVFSVAGGWVGGGVSSSSFCSDVQSCMGQNVTSAAAAAAIGSKLLQSNGLLVLTGSTAGLSPSSSMIAYSTSKAALHYMVSSALGPAACAKQMTRLVASGFNVAIKAPRIMQVTLLAGAKHCAGFELICKGCEGAWLAAHEHR